MSSMWLTRLRVRLKSALPRESFLYHLGHEVNQAMIKVQDRFGKRCPLREITDNSIFTREEEMSMCSIFPKEILNLTLELFQPRSVLDVGCGTGVSLDYFAGKGVQVRGLEGSELAISKARHRELITCHDLNVPAHLGERFDLVWCFEVAEHIHPKYVAHFLDTLTSHSDRILLSAAPPGQGGLGHLNEQPPEYWVAQMQEHGFARARETELYRGLPDDFAANILVFEKDHGPR